MNPFKPIFLVIFLGCTLCATAGSLPKASDVLRTMHLCNDYFTRKYPDPAAPTFVKKERPSNLWTRGVYFEGLMALNRIDPQQRNSAYITRWAQAHRYTPRNGIETRDADDYCCSQTYLELYLDSLDSAVPPLFNLHMLLPTMRCMENLIAQHATADWTWIDAIQMGLPVLTHLAHIRYLNGDDDAARYAEQGFRMYCWTRDTLAGGLLNKDEGLWWKD